MELARSAEVMNFFYMRMAESVLESGGDLDRFAGGTIVSFHSAPDEQGIEASVVARLENARAVVEDAMGLRVGVGFCGCELIYGRFGSAERATVTGLGPSLICAGRLARSENRTIVCARLAGNSAPSSSRADASFSIAPHGCVH